MIRPLTLQGDMGKVINVIKTRSNLHQSVDISIKYPTNDELTELSSPKQTFESLETSLKDNQDWQGQFNSLSNMRSLMKFNPELFEESSYVITITRLVIEMVGNIRTALAKNSLLLLQEGSTHISNIYNKLCSQYMNQMYSRLSDTSCYLNPEVERSLDLLYSTCSISKILSHLIHKSDNKNHLIRLQVSRGFNKMITRLQKEIFQHKEYANIIKCMGIMSRDSSSDVRYQSKENIKLIMSMSDQSENVQMQLNSIIPAYSVNNKLVESVAPDLERNPRIRLKRLESNKPKNLNRTDEIVKELAPMPLLNQKNLGKDHILKDGCEGDDIISSKPQLPHVQRNDLMQRQKKQPQYGRYYPELEALPELIKDIESEGKLILIKTGKEEWSH